MPQTPEEPWEEGRSVEGARQVREALGADTIRALHRESPLLDALTVTWALSEMALALAGLAWLPYGPLWALCALSQPFILFHWIMVSHDLCTHRRVGGERFAWLLSIVLTMPRFSLPTAYLHSHQLHHRFIGGERDGEAYKQGLDTLAKRWWFLTFPGAMRAGKLGPALPPPTGERARRLAIERWVFRCYVLSLLVGCFLAPKVFFFGHLLPVLVLGPILNTVRVVLEHAEADGRNPLFLGTPYRCGPFMNLVSLWNNGDAHIVHHLFPNVPWYRVPAALRVLRPLFAASGIQEQRSLVGILRGWLVDGRPHRQPWPRA